MSHKFNIAHENSPQGIAAAVIISGVITDEKNCGADIIAQIKKAMLTNPNVVVKLQNCYGGNIYEGAVVYNAIKQLGLTTYAEGIVASMGSIIFCAGKERLMSATASILTHKAKGRVEGSAEQIASYADQVKELDKQMAAVYAEATGMTVDDVFAKLMTAGSDTYLNAQQALELKVATKIVDGKIKASAPHNILLNSNIEAVASFYNEQIENLNPNNKTTMKNIAQFVAIAALCLTGDADEDKVFAAVNKMAEENSKMKVELDKLKADAIAAHKAACIALVDGAIKEKKITAAQKDTYVTLAEANFENTKKALEGMKGYTAASSIVGQEKKTVGEDRSNWTFGDYQKKDPKALAEMQKQNPDEFKQLKDSYVATLQS